MRVSDWLRLKLKQTQPQFLRSEFRYRPFSSLKLTILICTFSKAAIRFLYSYNIDSRTDFIVGEGLFARKVLYEISRPDFQILLSDLACITNATASSNSASLDFSLTFESFSESSSCRTWNSQNLLYRGEIGKFVILRLNLCTISLQWI